MPSLQAMSPGIHGEQTGLQAVITGVVIDGWGKGNLVKGHYTEIKCDHDGITTDCWRGTLDIARDAEHWVRPPSGQPAGAIS